MLKIKYITLIDGFMYWLVLVRDFAKSQIFKFKYWLNKLSIFVGFYTVKNFR